MKYYIRLIAVTSLGICLIGLLTAAVYWARDALATAGHSVSDRVFLVTLFAALGIGFGVARKFILQAATRDKGAQ